METELKEYILNMIYPVTAASYFDVDETSYLHGQACKIAEKLAKEIIIKSKSW